jgi:AraC-like DNA-binding protein/streptogramin lyase
VNAPNQGVFRYQVETGKLFRYIPCPGKDKSKDFPQSICVDKDGTIWVGTYGAGIYRYSPEQDKFVAYATEALKGDFIFTLCDYGDELIVGVHEEELKRFNKKTGEVSVFPAPEVHRKIIRYAVCFGDELWVGTQNGVYVINEKQNSVQHIPADAGGKYGLGDAIVDKIYRDREGGTWICTQFGGASYLPVRSLDFSVYLPGAPGTVCGRRISELAEGKDGTVWISTQDGGVCYWNPKAQTFVKVPESPDRQNVLSLFASDDLVGAGYFKGGIDLIIPGTASSASSSISSSTFSSLTSSSTTVSPVSVASSAISTTNIFRGQVHTFYPAQLGISEGSVFALYRDRGGVIWLGDGWNIFRSADKGRTFEKMEQFGYAYMRDILEDKSGNIWVATMGNGIFRYNPQTDQMVKYQCVPGDSTSIGTNEVTGISEDSKGLLWFSTDRGGLLCFNPETGRFRTYTKANGLPDNVTYKVVEDAQHRIWFGTDRGLVCLHPETDSLQIFTRNDGLPDNQFNYKSALAASDGTIWMGTINGLVSFNPQIVRRNTFVPPVYITGMYVQGRETPFPADGVQLPYRSNVGFDFVALSYTSPGANRYAYKMEGIDNDWNYTSAAHTASYAQLPPGDYLFRVRGSNNDGVWNQEEATLSVRILPPWWRTVWAYLIYIIVVSGSFVLTLRAYRRREVQKIREQQLLAELARERESHRTHEMFINQITYGACTPQGDAMSRADEQLMSQLIAKVRENLSDANYNVEALAAAMNMSRSSLHRKIKALTDLSSLDFIRIIRLKHAAELLQEGELRINEICDRVGFQSPSYFAKVFQKQFGVTPTEFAQQNKQRITDS